MSFDLIFTLAVLVGFFFVIPFFIYIVIPIYEIQTAKKKVKRGNKLDQRDRFALLFCYLIGRDENK